MAHTMHTNTQYKDYLNKSVQYRIILKQLNHQPQVIMKLVIHHTVW